jgi:hypothetical protein
MQRQLVNERAGQSHYTPSRKARNDLRQPLRASCDESSRCGDVKFLQVDERAGQGHYTPSCRFLELPLLASNFRKDFQTLCPTPHLTQKNPATCCIPKDSDGKLL